jgi:hypothetical protein
LSRYWNARSARVSAGELTALGAEVEPAFIATIERLQALHRPLHPDQGFAHRLERELLVAFGQTASVPAAAPSSLAAARAEPVPMPVWTTSRRNRRVAAAVASAALLAATLVVGIFAWRAADDRAAAPEGPATALPAPDAGLLFRVELPTWQAGVEAPSEPPNSDKHDRGRIDLFRVTLNPGDSYDGAGENYQGVTPDSSSIVTFVESGTVAIEVDGPAQWVRQDGSLIASLDAGSSVTLGANEALISAARTHRRMRPVNGPATLLELSDQSIMFFERAEFSRIAQGIDPAQAPPGPLVISFRQVSLAAGQTLGPPAPDAVVFFALEEGRIEVTLPTPGAGTPVVDRPFTYQPGATVLVSTGHGDAKEVRAAADGSATLLVVTLAPLVSWE